MKHARISAVFTFAFVTAFAGKSLAEELPAEFSDVATAKSGGVIGDVGTYDTACTLADLATSLPYTATATACYPGSTAAWSDAKKAAEAYAAAANDWFLRSKHASTGICGKNTSLSISSKSKAADDDVAKKTDDVTKAEAAAKTAAQALADADIDVKAWSASTEPGRTEKLISAQKKQALAAATKTAADAALSTANKALDDARKKRSEVEAALLRDAKAAAQSARKTFFDALDAAQTLAQRSPEDFETVIEDEKRRSQCAAMRELRKKAFGDASSAAEEADASGAASAAHASDILRKTSATSALTSAQSLIEQGGSPDHLVTSVMSALGADSKTTGTQTSLSLNLSSLAYGSEAKRLAAPVWLRNVFIRAAFPLSTTEGTPVTTAATSTSASTSTPNVKRFSLLLGGSFLDETDTRLPTNAQCYRMVLAYLPIKSGTAADDAEERKAYYDVCSRISANRARLAWRLGIGFFTPTDVDRPATKPELWAGALVWAPQSWFYLNALFQRIVHPEKIDTAGVGVSLGRNVGGLPSGVDGWGRITFDVLFLTSYAEIDKAWNWETRISASMRGKMFGNSVGSFAIGPRILSQTSDVGILATVALTYDSDQLIDSLLVPPAGATK